jgi:tetratricopeptide (TPR) repeat protein
MQQALLHHNAGRLTTAVGLYRRALDDPACPRIIWVKAANNISTALTQLGRPRAALEYLEPALVLAADLGPLLLGVLTNSLAWSSFYAGLVGPSVRRFEEAGPLYAAAGISPGEHYMDYSDALVDLRLIEEAAVVARAAAAEFDRHGARLMAAEARLRCARLALALGDAERARADADAAVADLRRQRRVAWVARAATVAVEASAATDGYRPDALRRLRTAATTLTRHGLTADAVEAYLLAGRVGLATGQRAPARRLLASAAALARRQPLVVRLRGRVAAAVREAAGGSPAGTLRECRAGLADLARHRAALPSVELRVLAAGHGAELGDLGLRALLPTGSASRVLGWLERTRAASLLTVQPPVPEVEEEVTALRGVAREIKAARRERGEEPRDLLARQGALEARIRRLSWVREAGAGESHRTVSVGELRLLLAGGWLVEYAPVDGRIVAVVVEPRRTRLIEAGSLRDLTRETDAVLFALRRMLRGGRFAGQARVAAGEALAALSAQLVDPLRLPPDTPLVVVPSGPLLRVPWSPLARSPVSVAPSATFWARGRRSRGQTASHGDRVALVAGPGLPGAAREVTALRRVYPGAAALLPPHSTAEATLNLVRHADLAHLACHGRLRSDSPLFSALELSDGPLTLHELFARGVAPHRVVLAACDSGVERSYAGGEVLGFVSALMARGTAGVVAAGLPIPDGASVDAMTALHEGLGRGESLARALHAARARIDPDRPEAYVAWCALTAYGAA